MSIRLSTPGASGPTGPTGPAGAAGAVPNMLVLSSNINTTENGNGLSDITDLATVGPTVQITYAQGDVVLAYVDVEINRTNNAGEANVRIGDDIEFASLPVMNGIAAPGWTRYVCGNGQSGRILTGIIPNVGVVTPVVIPFSISGIHNISLKYVSTNNTQQFRNRRLTVVQYKA